jgi:AcrR family transcriptional regulator
MARPRSDDKRQTILQAATGLIAEEGLAASTARIAKAAGVAEGTIFTYFATKDELLNQLYLALKAQLRLAYPEISKGTGLRESIWLYWSAYVAWGLAHPVERRALAKIQVSDRVTGATRALAAQAFHDISDSLVKAMALGGLRKQPPAFVGALMVAMAETAIDFIANNPELATNTCADAYAAFWSAVTSN